MRKTLIVLLASLIFCGLFLSCGEKEEEISIVKERSKKNKEVIQSEETADVKTEIKKDEKFEGFIKKAEEKALSFERKEPVKTKPVPVRAAPTPDRRLVRSPRTKFLANPLPNGVIFDDNLSVSIIWMMRGENITRISLAFRCIDNSQQWDDRFLKLIVYDDRGNKYGSSRKINMAGLANVWRNENSPLIPKNLPNGFTWFSYPIEIKIPKIAPIVRIEIEREKWGSISSSGLRQKLNMNFINPNFSFLDFQPKPEEIISPGEEIKIDDNLSMRLEEINSEKEVRFGMPCIKYTIPFTLKNNDYNPHNPLLASYIFYALYNNGRLSEGDSLTLYTDGTWSDGKQTQLTPKLPVPALSTRVYTYYLWTKIRKQEKTFVRMFLICYKDYHGRVCFKYLIPVSSGD